MPPIPQTSFLVETFCRFLQQTGSSIIQLLEPNSKTKEIEKRFTKYSVNVLEDLEKWYSQTTLTRSSG